MSTPHPNFLKSLMTPLLVFCSVVFYAQEIVTTAGIDASGSGGSISFTVGQISYINTESAQINVNQGVQQPYEIFSVGLAELASQITVTVYPNPTPEGVTISLAEGMTSHLSYQVLDYSGRVLMSDFVQQGNTPVTLSQLSAAAYLLAILEDGKTIQTFQIIKQ